MELIRSTSDARVVDFPLPVGPVTKHETMTEFGNIANRFGQPKIVEARSFARHDPQHESHRTALVKSVGSNPSVVSPVEREVSINAFGKGCRADGAESTDQPSSDNCSLVNGDRASSATMSPSTRAIGGDPSGQQQIAGLNPRQLSEHLGNGMRDGSHEPSLGLSTTRKRNENQAALLRQRATREVHRDVHPS